MYILLKLKKCDYTRAKTNNFKSTQSEDLLEVVQSGFGLLLCLLVKVFWDRQEHSLSLCTYPGYFQLKLLLLVVLMDKMNAGHLD